MGRGEGRKGPPASTEVRNDSQVGGCSEKSYYNPSRETRSEKKKERKIPNVGARFEIVAGEP